MKLTTAEVRVLLVRAKSGNDADAAQKLIAHFRDAIIDGGDFDRRLLDDYLLHAFGKILNDLKDEKLAKRPIADQAFGIKSKKGQYERIDNTVRNIQIAAFVKYLMLYRGNNWEDAIGAAANHFGDGDGGDGMVKNAYAEYKNTLPEDEWQLKSMLPEELLHS